MSEFGQLVEWVPAHEAALTVAGTMAAVVLAVWLARKTNGKAGTLSVVSGSGGTATAQVRKRKFSAGTMSAAVAFVICTSVSLNTSYRFTADGLGMTGTPERVLSCAAFEALLAMCVLGARERMADPDSPSPGWYGSAVWIFAALSAIPAWHEGGGLTTGTAVRIIIGAFGSALAAHSMLGLELKHRSGKESEAPLAQITRDLRERLMARMGLTVRNRTAAELAADRAMSRAVDLADAYDRMDEKARKSRRGRRCARRLAQWQDRAGLATSEERAKQYRARVAQRRYSTELEITEAESPWHTDGTPEAVAEARAEIERLREALKQAQTDAEAEREAHARHMEQLAETVEARLLAHPGTPLPRPRAEAHADVDEDDGEEPADCIEPPATDDEEAARAAAAAHRTRTRAEARVSDDGDKQDEAEDAREPLRELSTYPTKKDAIQALYRARIAPGDPRSINAIVEELRAEMQAQGISYDRAPAHRAVAELHPAGEHQDEQHERTAERQLAGV